MRTVQTDISSKLQLLNLWIFQRYVSFELFNCFNFWIYLYGVQEKTIFQSKDFPFPKHHFASGIHAFNAGDVSISGTGPDRGVLNFIQQPEDNSPNWRGIKT